MEVRVREDRGRDRREGLREEGLRGEGLKGERRSPTLGGVGWGEDWMEAGVEGRGEEGGEGRTVAGEEKLTLKV